MCRRAPGLAEPSQNHARIFKKDFHIQNSSQLLFPQCFTSILALCANARLCAYGCSLRPWLPLATIRGQASRAANLLIGHPPSVDYLNRCRQRGPAHEPVVQTIELAYVQKWKWELAHKNMRASSFAIGKFVYPRLTFAPPRIIRH